MLQPRRPRAAAVLLLLLALGEWTPGAGSGDADRGRRDVPADAAARGLQLSPSPNEARYSLATKVMSNGVEVIVAGDKSTLPGEPEVLRELSSSAARPTTLAPSTLTDHMLLLLPQEVTQTFLTTYTYMTTFLQDGSTSVSSREHVVTSVATAASGGPSEVHIATTVSSTVLEPQPATTDVVNTYFVTYTYYSTFLEGGSTVVRSEVATSSEVMTEKLFVAPKRTSSAAPEVTVMATQLADRPLYVFATRTYLTTFTYFTTLLQDAGQDRTSTVVKSRTRVVQNIETSVIPPSPLGSVHSSLQAGAPAVAMATTMGGQAMTITAMETQQDLQPTSTLEVQQVTPTTTVSSSMEEPNNIVTGSTIIFFDEEDQIDTSSSAIPTPTLSIEVASDHSRTPTPALSVHNTVINTGAATVVFPVTPQALTSTTEAATQQASIVTSILQTSSVTSTGATLGPGDEVIMLTQADGSVSMIPVSDLANKKPGNTAGPGGSEIQVSDLLSLGSLGINGFNALGPVINAMAGLIQSNMQPEVLRRNDSTPPHEEPPHPVYVPSAHAPMYIPVGGLAGDSAAAESQNYEGVANLNGDQLGWKLQGDEDDTLYPDTQLRHRPTLEKPLLGDGIPISPGEVITANSDVIVGKPAILGPRPPKINVPLGMRPPPLPPPGWNKPPPAASLVAPEHDPGPFPMPELSPDFVGLDVDPTAHLSSFGNGNMDQHPSSGSLGQHKPNFNSGPLRPHNTGINLLGQHGSDAGHNNANGGSQEHHVPNGGQHSFNSGPSDYNNGGLGPNNLNGVLIGIHGSDAGHHNINGGSQEHHVSNGGQHSFNSGPSDYNNGGLGPNNLNGVLIGIHGSDAGHHNINGGSQELHVPNGGHHSVNNRPLSFENSELGHHGSDVGHHNTNGEYLGNHKFNLGHYSVNNGPLRPDNSGLGHHSLNGIPLGNQGSGIGHNNVNTGSLDHHSLSTGPLRFGNPDSGNKNLNTVPLGYQGEDLGQFNVHIGSVSHQGVNIGGNSGSLGHGSTDFDLHNAGYQGESVGHYKVTNDGAGLGNHGSDSGSLNHHGAVEGNAGSLSNHKLNHHDTGSLDHHKITSDPQNHRPQTSGSLDHSNVNIGSGHQGVDVILHTGSFSNHGGNTPEHHINHRPLGHPSDDDSHHGMHIVPPNNHEESNGPLRHHNTNSGPLGQHGADVNTVPLRHYDTGLDSLGPHSVNTVPLGHHGVTVGFLGTNEHYEDPLSPHGVGTVLDVPKDTGTRMDPPPPAPTGINVEVTPGQGFNVDISPGHFQQHGVSEHISPSGIVLDAPLAGRPHRYPGPGHRQRPLPHRPMEFMTPPPPPSHFGGGNGPVIIPLNPNSPQIPRPRPEDLLITNHNDKDDHDDLEEPVELEEGELFQASNSRPLRPGQLPGRPFTHRPDVDGEKPLLQRPHPTTPTKPRPQPSGFTHHQQPQVPDKPRPVRPNAPELELSKVEESSHFANPHLAFGQKPTTSQNFEEIPQISNFDNNHQIKPSQGSKPQSPPFIKLPSSSSFDITPSEGSFSEGTVMDDNLHPPPHIDMEMAKVDKPPKLSKPLFDLETQANTPRPYIRPADFDRNPDDSVMGLSPPPPHIAVSSNSGGIRFPGADDSTHRPVVNIGGQRRPVLPPRTKPRPPPPYKFEIPTTEVPTTVDHRPRPPLYEIPGPSSIPAKEQDTAEQNMHSTAVPITTHRPRLRPRPRPPTTTPSSEEVVVIGKPVTTPEPVRDTPARRPVPVIPSQAPPRVPPTVISPTPVRESTIRTPTSTIKRPVIAPSSVRTTTAKTPTTTSRTTTEVLGSETVLGEESKHKTPSVGVVTQQVQSKFSDHSVIVSSGSETIFGGLMTKSSTETLRPTEAVTNEVLKPSGGSGYQQEVTVPLKEHDKVEDEVEDDDKKNDLGVSSSNDDSVTFDVETVAPTRYVTHTQTLTVTTMETTVLSSEGRQPSTLTVVLTKTHTSTIVDTVTETRTLVKPTSVVATVTTTVSATTTTTQYPPGSPFDPANYPTFPARGTTSGAAPSITTTTSSTTPSTTPASSNTTSSTSTSTEQENESLFVVVNDQRPGSGDDVNDVARRDEADGVNHAVLLGGVLVAAPPRHNAGPPLGTPGSSCRPDCSPARNELCQRVEGHMRCVCRPGFARMFPDRPCKPTYTYSMRLALGHLGLDPLRYEAALDEPTAPRFQQIAEASRQGLDRMVMQSDLRDVFHGVAVSGFQPVPRQDGVIVNFYVQLSDNIDEARLKDVFRKSLRTSNYSLGGTQLYADKEQVIHLQAEDFDECESPRFHDCSENARCFNLRGTYTCSCKEGFADLSENKLFPGRACSAELVGCEKCHYHGTCYSRGDDQLLCECFQWYAGENCHINLKVLLIALVTIGAVLLALLLACILLTWLKRSRCSQQPRTPGFLRYRGPPRTLDKRAMILDTSSEGSVDNIPPMAYMTPTQQPASSFSTKLKQHQQQQHSTLPSYSEQRDRSLTVMIPRAKYRPVPPMSPLLTMSTFGAEEKRAIAQEQKLIAMLEAGKQPQDAKTASSRRKHSGAKPQPSESATPRKTSAPKRPSEEPPTHNAESLVLPPGALVSAGFEVSATVGKKSAGDSDTEIVGAAMDGLASHGSNFTTLRTADSPKDPEKVECESQPMTGSGVQELTVSEARSYDETTIQPPTRRLHSNYGSKPSSRNLNNDEAHTMAERDIGSTFLMPQTHLYKPDRGSDISNFDSL